MSTIFPIDDAGIHAKWPSRRLTGLLDRNDSGVWGDEPSGEHDALVLRSTDQTVDGEWRISDPALRLLAPKERLAAKLEVGDLVVTKSSGSALHIGKTTLVDQHTAEEEYCYSNFMQRLRPGRTLVPKFLWYFMNSPLAREQLGYYSSTTTGLANLNGTTIGRVELPLPATSAQSAIVDYLDSETARIDALIDRKQRFIDLLLEKRTALITHAVTKGLDPSAAMKDSGVPFIGAVPSEWDVAPLYARYEVTLGKMLDAGQITGEHLAPYVRNADVQWDFANVSDLDEMDFKPEDRRKFALRPGDLLVCEGGEVGRTAVWRSDLECYYQKAVHRLRPRFRHADVPRFFFYVMYASAKAERFRVGSNVATIGHLTATQLRHHRFAFPPMAQQVSIVEYLDEKTGKLDRLARSTSQSIDLLREYRTALISAAVTGQIDIPGTETTEDVA